MQQSEPKYRTMNSNYNIKGRHFNVVIEKLKEHLADNKA